MRLFEFVSFCLISSAFCQTSNILDVAKQLGATTLLELVNDAGITDVLTVGDPLTLFAPSNEAFSNLPASVLAELRNDKQLLADVLKYHVLNGKVFSTMLADELVVPTLLDGSISRVNIYQQGQVVTYNGCQITTSDQNATNGVVHLISKVELPPNGTVVDAAKRDAKLSTLWKAIVAAGLMNILAGPVPRPLTLFAPTDDAFNALPPGTLDALLNDKSALIDLLTYHAVNGTYYSVGLTSGTYSTVEGKSVTIAVDTSGITVNDAKVTTADVPGTNGVLHVIDKVLTLPSSFRFQ
ncbi:hypothetical protein FSP39_024068 [Pinctada imbricata]|uniref:FAS1 domain-containing protein n=1 Tax=Pinctada imbricata TaxID=66713 RepID=A0AA89C105_PINIB|nr:hypothetical protein FSP39_024068 [Pinctada imbricata]